MTKHLLGLRAENYKRIELVNVEFPPDGGVVAIMGENEAGKSSLLDALESTIAGRRAAKSVQPIHRGADSARVVARFDDIVVTRTFKPSGTAIEVRGAEDGRRIDRAEDLLSALYSHVALDPLAFSRLNDADQVATLLPLIGFDPRPLDEEFRDTYDRRTLKNREVRDLEGQVAAQPDPDRTLPTEEISVADLAAKIREATEQNTRAADHNRTLEAYRGFLVDEEAQIVQIEEALAEARRKVENRRKGIETLEAQSEEFTIVDTTDLEAQIASAEDTNRAIRAQSDRVALADRLKTAREEAAALSISLEEIEARKQAALADARMPVPGLGIDTALDALTLDGIPFSQASTGVKIRTGTAIAIALNPDLRLIIIRDASLLDEGNRAVIDELAQEHGFLVLMEIADTSAPVGVVIEEGMVREVRPSAPEKSDAKSAPASTEE